MKQLYCSNCGTLMPASAKFCPNCGAATSGAAAAVFRAQDPPVDNPQLVQQLPKQALRSSTEYITRRHLSFDALIFFFFNFLSKSILIFGLVLVGAILRPVPFIFGLIVYFIFLSIITLFVYNNFMYEINEDGLFIESGVIFKRQVSLPYEQIQNVNIERTVLDRLFGLTRINIETAGAAAIASTGAGSGILKSKSEAYIPGLHMDQAKKIHDLLIEGADGNMND